MDENTLNPEIFSLLYLTTYRQYGQQNKTKREIKIEIPSRFQDKPGAREREEEKEKV